MSKKKTDAVADAVASEVQVTIDISKMKIKDLKLLGRASRGDLPEDELLDFLNRVVVEDIEEMPISALPIITAALSAAVGGASDPETDEGN